jgi:Transcriptional regulator
MNEKFFDLKKEKQDRMINAALKVFAMNGYRHASTDDIVAEAGISKGLLFHYFQNKLGLYSFLFDYSVRFMLLELSACGGKDGDDFFELWRRMEGAKFLVLKNYPYMQEFIDSTRYEDVKEALYATETKKGALEDLREEILSHADLSRFRPEVDVELIKIMLDHTVRGILNKSFREGTFHPNMMQAEINSYLQMLKKITYLS